MTDVQPIPTMFPAAPTNADIERAEARLLDWPQVPCPLTHRFAPGVYFREIFMPAGTFVIGAEHLTEHFNVVLSGRARVWTGTEYREISAPDVFVSGCGVRKVLEIIEDMRWATIHATAGLDDCGQDIAKLEDKLRVKSPAVLAHEQRKELTA